MTDHIDPVQTLLLSLEVLFKELECSEDVLIKGEVLGARVLSPVFGAQLWGTFDDNLTKAIVDSYTAYQEVIAISEADENEDDQYEDDEGYYLSNDDVVFASIEGEDFAGDKEDSNLAGE
jgi:hypothetical protein